VKAFPKLVRVNLGWTKRTRVLCTLLVFHTHVLAASSTSSQRQAETVISPQGDGGSGVRDSGIGFPFYGLFAIACLAGGAWLWVRSGRRTGGFQAKKASIVIEEVRPLGNRQHLILASCQGRSFLLGVSPGRIETISEVSRPESGR
jgi:flagellar biogenesis protein FliO